MVEERYSPFQLIPDRNKSETRERETRERERKTRERGQDCSMRRQEL